MATLSTLLAPDLLTPSSSWTLLTNVNGYSGPEGSALTTQACRGRSFQLLESLEERLWVQLLEDGYRCWIDRDAVLGRAVLREAWEPSLLAADQIQQRLPAVLSWSERAEQQPNSYLWGGTTEPDMDCSGLMQMAFASAGIWIPRDAYQQERFCEPVAAQVGQLQLLQPGDLIFFGSPERCSHVALYLGNGLYRHSSGKEHGRNGIGVDSLHPNDTHPVGRHYRAELRGAGRVVRCHDGSTLA